MEELYKKFVECGYKVSTDTRKDVKGSLFFCLSGENFDGNKFAKEALEKGARCVVVDSEECREMEDTFYVKNTTEALQELAKYHRRKMKAEVIGITGSNGKTTTKELIYSVLKQKYRVVYTQGNLNNHIGVPITLLSIREDTELAVVEMGANHPKEIEFLCGIACPDYGYITSFGKAHLEFFLTLEGVINTKTELYESVKKKGGLIFVNKDNEVQVERVGDYRKVYSFSEKEGADVRTEVVEEFPYVKIRALGVEIATKLVGIYNRDNISAGVMIGKYFGVRIEDIKRGIEEYVPSNSRSQIVERGNGNRVLLDAYNANPTSMRGAIESFRKIEYGKKVVVLGDMKELGVESEREHAEIVGLLWECGFDEVLLVGDNFGKVGVGYRVFGSAEQAGKYLAGRGYENTFFLVKGSRSMTMEKAMEGIK